jgi:hypothetical protein
MGVTADMARMRSKHSLDHFVPGCEASLWNGFGAPKDTPAPIINSLNEAINVALADPKIITQLADLGRTPFVGSPVKYTVLSAGSSLGKARLPE